MDSAVTMIVEPLRHPYAAGLIFAFTFVLISFRQMRFLPIGRPSGALLGAVLMVLFGVMSPEEAYALVNWDTICLLLGMMIIAEHLRDAGLFERLTRHLGTMGSPFQLLVTVSITAALLSALLVNDTICVVMTPLILAVCDARRLNPFPYLMALATSSNIGSALTLTGNPQNMIIGSISRLDYGRFILLMGLPVTIAMMINLYLLWLFYRKRLTLPAGGAGRTFEGEIPHTRKLRIGAAAICITCYGFFAGFSMAFSALAGAALVITLHRRDPRHILERLEWSLLMFFAALFVVIGGLKTSGLSALGTRWALGLLTGDPASQAWMFSGVTLVGSNLFSNVPFVLLASQAVAKMASPDLFWCLLAYVSTVAGNLTLFGSVANLIVAESARDRCEIGFLDYAKFGIPSTLLTLGSGIAVLIALLAF
ncbi:MAG TPA: anion transporter [Candidatus Ozemobacteraceae bacterium]|nr:anion transporter [Candidatus Ozemobacteraceae bacterium]